MIIPIFQHPDNWGTFLVNIYERAIDNPLRYSPDVIKHFKNI